MPGLSKPYFSSPVLLSQLPGALQCPNHVDFACSLRRELPSTLARMRRGRKRPLKPTRLREPCRQPPRSPPPQRPVRPNARARAGCGGCHRTPASVRAARTSPRPRASRSRRARTTPRRGFTTFITGLGAVSRRAGRRWGVTLAPPMGGEPHVRSGLRRCDPHGRSKAGDLPPPDASGNRSVRGLSEATWQLECAECEGRTLLTGAVAGISRKVVSRCYV